MKMKYEAVLFDERMGYKEYHITASSNIFGTMYDGIVAFESLGNGYFGVTASGFNHVSKKDQDFMDVMHEREIQVKYGKYGIVL